MGEWVAALIVGVLAAFIGWLQWETSRTKLLLELFDRRLRVLRAIERVVFLVKVEGPEVLERALEDFIIQVADAPFLFTSDVNELVDDFKEKLWAYRSKYRQFKRESANDAGAPDTLMQELEDLDQWFSDRSEVVHPVFVPYLTLHPWFGRRMSVRRLLIRWGAGWGSDKTEGVQRRSRASADASSTTWSSFAMWPYLKVSARVWTPLVAGLAWVFGHAACVAWGVADAVDFQRSGSILVAATLWTQATYSLWWVPKFLQGDASPFGRAPAEDVVKTLVEIGNVTVEKSVRNLRKVERVMYWAIVVCAIAGTTVWGYGDILL